jgi:hypothetical protein
VAAQTVPEPVVQLSVVQPPVVKANVTETAVTKAPEPKAQIADMPIANAPTAKVETAGLQTARLQTDEAQTLALPKDRGVITPASVAVAPVPNIETPVQTVQAAPVPEPSLPAPVVIEPETQVAKAQVAKAQDAKVSEAPTITAVQPAPAVTAVPVAAMESRPMVTPVLKHLEVSNGNGTTGMARKVATYLRESGYAKARLTNQKPYTVQTTQIQYRYGHQADAEQLRASLPSPAAMVQNNNLRDDINLRVLLGKDLVQHTVYFNGSTQKLLVTLRDVNS